MKKSDHSNDTIEIHVSSKNIKCKYKSDGSDADVHEVGPGQYVRWSCDAGNYAIFFGEHTPFANSVYYKRKGDPLTIPVNLRVKGRKTFKYSVVVERGVNDHVVRDPQIVIN